MFVYTEALFKLDAIQSYKNLLFLLSSILKYYSDFILCNMCILNIFFKCILFYNNYNSPTVCSDFITDSTHLNNTESIVIKRRIENKVESKSARLVGRTDERNILYSEMFRNTCEVSWD